MKTYLILFLIALCASLTLTPMVRRLCERHGWLDLPGERRRIHGKATPRLGGVAVFTSLLIALAVLPLADNYISHSLQAEFSQLLVVLTPAALIFGLGVWDDLKGLDARFKLMAQIATAMLLYGLGVRVEALSLPIVGSIELPGIVGFAITVFWVVAVTNAFNLIDGVDGLAAGAALFASLVMVVVSIALGHRFVTVISIAMAGALIGFLRYNFNPASIFLGDSGALFVGFVLAALSVKGAQKASTAVAVAIPLLAFGLPVIDTGLTIIRRFLARRPLFKGDREHIHHMLLARGWSQRRVVLSLYGACAILGLNALLFVTGDGIGHLTGVWLFVVGMAVLIAVNRLDYHEMEELREGLKREFSFVDRRLRMANNIGVRRASGALAKAQTLDEVFSAVREMLDLSGFVCATVELSRGVSARPQVAAAAAAAATAVGIRHRMPPPPADAVADNGVFWAWTRDQVEVSEITESPSFWSLRLSLVAGRAQWGYINLYWEMDSGVLLPDTKYLCDLFQHQMALAAERVLGAFERESGQRSASKSSAKHTHPQRATFRHITDAGRPGFAREGR
ncbi:MAG TPA: MraY family glycosyltransferase [Blastocatellia bacterium]|nr:MraY family glycosyltransferase [Blastocatellia bacterium]